MRKRERYFQKVAEYKERFRNLPTETIRQRLESGGLYKEAAVAYREVLEERGLPVDGPTASEPKGGGASET